MDAKLTAGVEKEFDQAVEHYEVAREGLGVEFTREVDRAIGDIRRYPLRWPQYRGEIRRYLLERFHLVFFTESARSKLMCWQSCISRGGRVIGGRD
jgi:hypothetical protein